MLNFPCLILKVNPCLFSSFPFDNTQFHHRWEPWTQFQACFHEKVIQGFPLVATSPGWWNGAADASWEPQVGRAWAFCVPANKGPSFPEWHALLLQMENYFPFPLSQPLCVCVCVLSHSDSLRPVDCSPPGSSVHGIFQVRMLEWVAIFFSRGSSQPRERTFISCVGRQILYHLSHQGSPSK